MNGRKITFVEALHEALQEEMTRDEAVVVLGEDISYGGRWGVTEGLEEEFGEQRVLDTPISESAIVGVSLGAALNELRPVAEIMYSELLPFAMDHLTTQASQARVPFVVMVGSGLGAHGPTYESWFVHVPGIHVVMPSTPYDAKGLMKTAIRHDKPVLFFEDQAVMDMKGHVPKKDYLVPLGSPAIKRKGTDVTVVATGQMVHRSLTAAEELQAHGIDVEVIDLRTLDPLTMDPLFQSVKKTGKLAIVHEAWKTCGIGSEIAASIAERKAVFHSLEKPICRITTPDIPLPRGHILTHLIPDKEKIVSKVQHLVSHQKE